MGLQLWQKTGSKFGTAIVIPPINTAKSRISSETNQYQMIGCICKMKIIAMTAIRSGTMKWSGYWGKRLSP
jgi:hypothetical protein